nr:hypothetical protein [uncultured Allomuricauda sp.]
MRYNRTKDRNRSRMRLIPIVGMVSIISFLIFNQAKQAERVYNDTIKALELLVINMDKGKAGIAHLSLFDDCMKKIYNH